MKNLSNLGIVGPLGYSCQCGGMLLLEKVQIKRGDRPTVRPDIISVSYHWTCTECDYKIPKDQKEDIYADIAEKVADEVRNGIANRKISA